MVAARHALGICAGTAPSVLLSLWPVRASSSAVHQRRIALVPAKCQGATFRWTIEGWGLITMQLGGSSLVGLVASHTNHNSAERARKWEQTLNRTLGSVSAWDWPEVSRVSRRLNRQIRKLAVSKVGSRVVLPDAALSLSPRRMVPWCSSGTRTGGS